MPIRTRTGAPAGHAWPASASGASSRSFVPVAAGEVLLADVAGVGEYGAQLGADARLGQLLAACIQQGMQQGAAGRVL
jgi:hypothetical protein